MTFPKNESVPYETEYVRIYRYAFSSGEGPMTKCSVNKKKNHDRYRKDDSNDEDVDTVTGMLDDVVLVASCADREIAQMYTFVVKSVCHIMRHTLQETLSLTTSIFRQTILLRRMTFFFDSSWKRIHAWVRKIERISPISSISTSLSYFFEFDRKESRLDETSGRRRFVV